ncbi:universal stress protein [Halalkalicoccus jeotgali]|uniref:Stress response protein n=1 Tax=Halalkalicoccus jeotgali (strain DSM 18796 / CECT 7217 / JCM 14584 / KCTC 4019 / B3) TaxID=795797 RepID=D8J432_HALJB|nr:universal stress protein [Halalkalicoccus jeotgali]ADJ15424.1 stress response protein [Halalkalicoccus jeotgali B3]ELY35800.1 stress response protein [Halalkalicoccus jeotgali B3]
MYNDILVPTDGGRKSKRAAEHAIELAAALDATVHALYVMDLPGTPRTPYIYGDEDEMKAEYRKYGEDVTEGVCEMAAAADVECVTAIRQGSIPEGIINYADREALDLIVMVSGYRGRFGGILGTTTERVVRGATVPVTSFRTGQVRQS